LFGLLSECTAALQLALLDIHCMQEDAARIEMEIVDGLSDKLYRYNENACKELLIYKKIRCAVFS
ncbi:hypothetical protein CCACVL1_27841, partial [Corchorus capsularis]